MGMPGKDGQLDFCTVTLGSARIMFSRQDAVVGRSHFIVQDPFGYRVWFYQTVGEMKPPSGAKVV